MRKGQPKSVYNCPDAWVPESHCFKTASECLEKFPEDPACGLYNHKSEQPAILHRVKNFLQQIEKLAWQETGPIEITDLVNELLEELN